LRLAVLFVLQLDSLLDLGYDRLSRPTSITAVTTDKLRPISMFSLCYGLTCFPHQAVTFSVTSVGSGHNHKPDNTLILVYLYTTLRILILKRWQ